MARKSRVAGNVIDTIPAKKGIYRTGIYARLSSEDKEEDTLENQIYLLKSHVESQTDMLLTDTYVDNGFSGTNFQRPQFIRMMEDVKSGKINCIVVKDLSRLGRDYIETGNYIENVFPFLNVRFVSVTDGFDTVNGDGVEAMVVSFKNLVNDVYAKDISRKIISAFRTKQRNGEYIGLVAPFGYLKSQENKNKFVVDEQTAPVVKMIFKWYADGRGLDYITRTLNEMDIDCPRKYRHRIGITISDRYKDSRWGRSAVKTILTNRAYIGDMVQGKVKQELCNNVCRQYVDKEEWIIVENTHEAVIERDLFFHVQELIEKKSREQAERREKSGIRGHKEENFLKGYLRCGCCGKSFNLSQTMRAGKITRQYYCSGYQTLRSAFCANKERINKDMIEQTVYEAVQSCILQLADEKAWKVRTVPEKSLDEEKRIAQIDREICQLSVKMADLYRDTAERILDDSDYILFKTDFTKRKETLEAEKKQLLAAAQKLKKKPEIVSTADYLKQCRRSKKLTRQMVETFVDGVKIYGRDRIEVQLLCQDEILRRLEG